MFDPAEIAMLKKMLHRLKGLACAIHHRHPAIREPLGDIAVPDHRQVDRDGDRFVGGGVSGEGRLGVTRRDVIIVAHVAEHNAERGIGICQQDLEALGEGLLKPLRAAPGIQGIGQLQFRIHDLGELLEGIRV